MHALGEPLPDDSLAELYDVHGPRLYRYALLILADAAAAEDAVQEAFCHIARAMTRNRDAVTVRYASRVVRNECYTMLRKGRRLVPGELPLLDRASPEASEEERMVLSDALEGLPPEQREIVFLKVLEGLTFQEIADVCDISINTAASRHRYALAALRRTLEPPRSDT